MKELPVGVLKECPSVRASLYSLHVSSGFSGRAGSDMSMSHVFHQNVLETNTLVGYGSGDEVARARAKCDLGLLLCSVGSTTLLGLGSSPKLLEQKP